MPLWFTQRGGFAKRSNTKYFVRFARKALELFGEEVRYVITLNEPNVYTSFSYALGQWPPQGRNPFRALAVYRNLVSAHRQVYRIAHRLRPHLHVGIAMAMSNEVPYNPRAIFDVVPARILGYLWNYWFLDRIRKTQDFIGVNYYMTNHRKGFGLCHPKLPKSDLGWSMDPKMLENVLVETWQRYGTPLMVTENGLADMHDRHRKWWLEESIAAMDRAIERGVALRGYLHWSLLDNFEWAYGWWPKFGLVAVDRTTMKRTVRPSARWFAERIKSL
jgi:beta-glucosidase